MAGINELLGGLVGSGSAEAQKLIGPLQDLIESSGGISGLLEKLKSNGLVGSGENAKIDPSKITSALGSEQVSALAQKAGLSVEQAQQGLSELLPALMEKVSAAGNLPGADQATELLKKVPGGEGIADKLGGLLGGGAQPPAPPA